MAGDTLDAAEHLVAAEAAVSSDRNVLERAGLLFSDADLRLDAAEESFEAGQPDAAVEHADTARELVDGAASAGAKRIAIAVGAGLLVLVALALVVRRARRSA
jgi:hypothetical protein